MKIYHLEAIINNQEVANKNFISRKIADKYLEKLLNRYNLEVGDVIYRDHQHNQEFVCNDYSRILIKRVEF